MNENFTLAVCRTCRAEAKFLAIETRFSLVCRLIAVAMGQIGAEIWANRPDLQPVHGKSDTLLRWRRDILKG